MTLPIHYIVVVKDQDGKINQGTKIIVKKPTKLPHKVDISTEINLQIYDLQHEDEI